MPVDPKPVLTVATGRDAGVIVVRVAGQLTAVSVALLRTRLGSVWQLPDVSVVVMDLAEVVFCDSAGLGGLVDAWRDSRARGIRLMLAGAGTQLIQVLELTGLDSLFEIHPQVAAALGVAAQ
ncbi:STAS domain-containing protein [Microbispora sp. CA-102843]|uniref:STAS domain-containing protein n=1 Tax=Microbispora sp. CA-102843 TaxID=3239952 RepID=UPI003D8BB1D4